jgi:carboxymethylenebutenolidase
VQADPGHLAAPPLEDDLRGARRPVRFEVYPRVGHWFAEADRPEAYDAAAAALAFRRTVAFLRSQLQKEAATPLQGR